MKQSAEENELRIESEIGRNVADYIFNKAKEKVFTMKHEWYGGLAGKPMEAIGVVHSEEFLYLKDLQEICNQPPLIKEMTAAEFEVHPIEKIQEAFSNIWKEATDQKASKALMSMPPNGKEDADFILQDAIDELKYLRALKQNSEGKE